jgi:hypothetical protein
VVKPPRKVDREKTCGHKGKDKDVAIKGPMLKTKGYTAFS